MTLLLWIFVLLGVIGFFQSRSISKRLDALEQTIANLSAQLSKLQKGKYHDITPTAPTFTVPEILPSAELLSSETIINPPSFEMPAYANAAIDWLKENWTGFIGVSILVLGIIFGVFYLGF